MGRAADLGRKVGALLAALFLIAAPASAACVDPNSIQVEYGALSFTQTRHLNGIRTPLVARGRATIAAERVDWHVTSPMNVLTTITRAGISQSIDGGAPQRVSTGGGGDAFLSSAGLFDMLVGDFDSLNEHYTVTRGPAGAGGSWTLRLTPRAASLARAVSSIEVAGCERVAQVEVRQANGDRMEISLAPSGG